MTLKVTQLKTLHHGRHQSATFHNDNTSFVKVIKTTQKAVNENEDFHFDVTSEFGDDFPVWLTVLATENETESELTMVPSGITTVIEDEEALDGEFKLVSQECEVWNVDMDTMLDYNFQQSS